eukprot:CAMPEP_0114252044 /NCGR_PEP_ID=MMETSP0058-20121206/15613_1 /TAXON_ID=36894 /ORGANISM="Pyramimonas parkeae, CCMP726" /LENGTH=326 /DNA_ID=CAMNT_0001365925 /DNA_START=170 /DNA_END=1151 /DNA_ORIENTATION=+
MGLLPARGFTKVFRQAGYPDERAQDEVGKAKDDSRFVVCAAEESASTESSTDAEVSELHVVPPFLNSTPHSREVRQHFYKDCSESILAAVRDGKTRMRADCVFPELNTEMDVYRVGTMLELIRTIANKLANEGLQVKVCVQGSMGQGVFTALPLSLSGVRRIMELMGWGVDEDGSEMLDKKIFLGAIGAEEVSKDDDAFIIIQPTSIVGHSIIPPMVEMMDAVGDRPVLIFNQKMTDIQSAGGVMSTRGRQGRIDFTNMFETVYHFRLLYNKPYFFPIYGALRYVYGEQWEIYKRTTITKTVEIYNKVTTVPKEPTPAIITKAIRG